MTDESTRRILRQNPPVFIDEQTGLPYYGCSWTPVFADEENNAEFSLRGLNDAGWVQRVARGLYEFVEDPRDV